MTFFHSLTPKGFLWTYNIADEPEMRPTEQHSLPFCMLLLGFTYFPFLLLCVESNSRKMLFSQENPWCWSRKKTSASPTEHLLIISLHLVCFFKYSGELRLSDTDVHGSSLARWLWGDTNRCRVPKCKQLWKGVVDTWLYLKSVGQCLSSFTLISVIQVLGMEVMCMH